MHTKTLLEIDNIIRYAKTIEQTLVEYESLSLLQIKALNYLFEKKIQTITDLAFRLNTSPASTSILIERLVKKSLVSREHTDSDRRKVHVSLTDFGMQEHLRLEKKKQEVFSDAQSPLSEEETLLLNRLFVKLTT